jgi:hypothetical protein
MDEREILYTKKKDVTIYLTAQKKLLAKVSHDDLRHKMILTVEFSQPQLIIDDVRCQMKVYPHADCIYARDALRMMIGKKVKPGIMPETKALLGNRGCTHLINLFHEACYSVYQAQGIYRRQDLEQMVPGLSLAQMTKVLIQLRPELIDSCVSWTPESKLIMSAQNTAISDNPKINEFIKKHQA